MPPDLNSLPPSRSITASPQQSRNWSSSMEGNNNNTQSPSPRSSSIAPMSTADISHRSSLSGHRSSPQSHRPSMSDSRRRSGIGMHLNLSDQPVDHPEHRPSFNHSFRTASPTSLGGSPIIATGDPHHQRAPSLGEIHQELEQEQEAQVNRLLQMIRQQQVQLQQLHHQQQHQLSGSSTAVIDDPTPSSERSASFPSLPPLPTPGTRSMQIPLSSLSTRRGSRNSSHPASPGLHPTGSQPTSALDPAHSSFSSEWSVLGGNEAGGSARRTSRDDGAFYQAEAAMLSRENQMLRMRIRELERQISDQSTSDTSHAASRDVAHPADTEAASASHAGEETEKT